MGRYTFGSWNPRAGEAYYVVCTELKARGGNFDFNLQG